MNDGTLVNDKGELFRVIQDGGKLSIAEGNFAALGDLKLREEKLADASAAQKRRHELLQAKVAEGYKSPHGAPAAPSNQADPKRTDATELSPRYRDYVDQREFQRYAGRISPASTLEAALDFDDPEQLHREVIMSYHLEDDWYETHPDLKAVAKYRTDGAFWDAFDGEGAATDEFFLVDASHDPCPVFLWTHESSFDRLHKVSDSLDEFLAGLTSP